MTTDTALEAGNLYPGQFNQPGTYRIKVYAFDEHMYGQYSNLIDPPMDSIGDGVLADFGAQTADSLLVEPAVRDSVVTGR